MAYYHFGGRIEEDPVPPESTADKVRAALAASTDFLTVDQLCLAAFGRVAARERAAVSVAIHRLGDEVEKRAAGYRRKR